MEQPRIAYLLNNARFVLSEDSPVNPYGLGLNVVPYAQLADCCRDWLQRSSDREQTAQANFRLFRGSPMTEFLKRVLSPSIAL